MSETKKNGTDILKDDFRFDHDLDEERPTVFSEVARGERTLALENPHITKEQSDVPSIFLRGVIPGATSTDKSEDPNFQVVKQPGSGPEGVTLTPKEWREIQDASCRRALVDPLYAAVLTAYRVFIIGKGFQVSAIDENPQVQEYIDEFIKANHWDGRDRDVVNKTLKSGEVFVRLFTKGPNGQVARVPAVRLINHWEIESIEVDPKDREIPVNYLRPYLDVNGHRQVEKIPAHEIIHVKFGDLDSLRGLPPFTVIIQACEEYRDWSFNRVVFNRLKTAFYLEEIVDGSPSRVTTTDESTPNAIKTGERGKVIKRMPKVGSKLTHNKAVEYKWLSPNVQADDAKEDGRMIRLKICAGAQIPEMFLGDSGTSTYTNALTAQNPFVRNVQWFQDLFEGFVALLFHRVIQHGIDNKFLSPMSTITVMQEKSGNVTLFRRFKKLFAFKEQFDDQGNIVVVKPIQTQTGVLVNWPTLIEKDLLKDSQAYQLHQSMEIVSRRTLAQKLGYDFDEEQRQIQNEAEAYGSDDEDFDAQGKDRDDDIAGKKDPKGGDGE